jgi:hypothetical protein
MTPTSALKLRGDVRVKAQKAGSLKSTKEQKVVTSRQDDCDIIVIESSDPSVVYVPVYDPVEVYNPGAGALLAWQDRRTDISLRSDRQDFSEESRRAYRRPRPQDE